MSGFRRGVRLGIDVGKARVGVARCDPDGMLAVPVETVPRSEHSLARIADLTASLKAAEKRIAQFEAKERAGQVPAIVEAATRVGSFRLAAQNLGDVASADDVRDLVNGVRDRLGSDAAVVALGAVVNGRPVVVVATNDAARTAGAKAGALAKRAAGVLGGGGGGRDDVAQGGGTDASAVDAALAAVTQELRGA